MNTMKTKLLIISYYFIMTSILIACNQYKETILYEEQEYWGEWYAGDTTSIQYNMRAVKKGNDTIYHTTYYYPNGVEKTKTEFINDRLKSIYFVNDTIGNPYDFGKIENGTGHVKQYDHQGTLIYSGNYKSGNKEGWWYSYHFKGKILDSIIYKDGVNISDKDTTWIDDLFGDISKMKNNWYD